MIRALKGVDLTLLKMEFLMVLDWCASKNSSEFVITSGFRSGKGPHATGLAVDLRVRDSVTRYNVLRGLLSMGFKRVGIGGMDNLHIHVDCCEKGFDQYVCWMEK